MAKNERISADTFRELQEIFALANAQVQALSSNANNALFGAWLLTEGERGALEQTIKTARELEKRINALKEKMDGITDWTE